MSKATKIAELKTQYPTINVGSDEVGYTELNAKDYEATIEKWALAELELEAKAEAQAKAQTDRAALLTKLGITEDEAKLLLS
jgi:hypothetical protein